jgi:hypothetical protein
MSRPSLHNQPSQGRGGAALERLMSPSTNNNSGSSERPWPSVVLRPLVSLLADPYLRHQLLHILVLARRVLLDALCRMKGERIQLSIEGAGEEDESRSLPGLEGPAQPREGGATTTSSWDRVQIDENRAHPLATGCNAFPTALAGGIEGIEMGQVKLPRAVAAGQKEGANEDLESHVRGLKERTADTTHRAI